MAKLSARGRTELARVEKVLSDGAHIRISFLSDGHCLVNSGCGWKDTGKVTNVEHKLTQYVEKGWTVTKSSDRFVWQAQDIKITKKGGN